jgi:putative ABC transport system ATP-binding protein
MTAGDPPGADGRSGPQPPSVTGKPEASPEVLRLEGVGRRLGERWVLRDVSLTVLPGERVALLGESGSGKSTLLHLIAGLDRADEGRIEVAGHRIDGRDADASAQVRAQAVGFVFQAFHLIAHLSLLHNVAVPLLLLGVGRTEAFARAGALLDRLGLAGRHHAMPRELSGGEQQRVALARALVHRPALVLADEPTGNLDPGSAARALDLLAEETAASGAALLMVTHSIQAAAACTRRLELDGARLRSL